MFEFAVHHHTLDMPVSSHHARRIAAELVAEADAADARQAAADAARALAASPASVVGVVMPTQPEPEPVRALAAAVA